MSSSWPGGTFIDTDFDREPSGRRGAPGGRRRRTRLPHATSSSPRPMAGPSCLPDGNHAVGQEIDQNRDRRAPSSTVVGVIEPHAQRPGPCRPYADRVALFRRQPGSVSAARVTWCVPSPGHGGRAVHERSRSQACWKSERRTPGQRGPDADRDQGRPCTPTRSPWIKLLGG